MIERVKFKIIKNMYCSTDNTYSIMLCKLKQDTEDMGEESDTFTLVGNLFGMSVGQTYTFDLERQEHKKYGTQYTIANSLNNAQARANNIDISPEQNLNILKSISVSEKLAEIIHKAYPNFVELILQGQADSIDYKNKIKGMDDSRFKAYVNKINNMQTSIIVQSHFAEYNFSDSEVEEILTIYPTLEEIQQAIDKNVYHFLFTIGRNWDEVDKLLLELKSELKVSNQRCEMLMCHLCRENEKEGSTRINARIMAQVALDIEPELVPKMKIVAIDSEYLFYDEETNYISLQSTYNKECFIANHIKSLLNHPINFKFDWKLYKDIDDAHLTDEQAEMLRLVSEKSFGLLVAGSGCGKSYTLNNVVHMLKEEGKSYTLVAPTGIASRRMKELTNCEAHTIHRLYRMQSKISSDVCIVDEISMCGVEHLSMLCKMVSPKTKLFFVGDEAQLASIACGNILQDLLSIPNIPKVTLTKVFRYGTGSLATIATDIRNSKPFLKDNQLVFNGSNAKGTTSGDGQYQFIQLSQTPIKQVLNAYSELLKEYDKKDILILSPYNVGSYGTHAINNAIQRQFNTNFKTNNLKLNKDVTIAVNDLIINKKNNYDVACYDDTIVDSFEDESAIQHALYNGSIGTVVSCENVNKVVGEFDNELLVLDKELTFSLKLGYAVSIHAIQGNQRKAIIVLTTNAHQNMLTNNLLYVALTRASEKVIHIGEESAINNALQKHETLVRETWLKDLLK